MNETLARMLRPMSGQPLMTGFGLSAGMHLLLAIAILLFPMDIAGLARRAEMVQTVKLVELPPPPPPPPPPEPEKPRPQPPPPPPARQLPVRSPRPVSATPPPPSANAQAVSEEAVGPVGEAIGTSGPVVEPSAARGQASGEAAPAQAFDWSAYHGAVWARIHRVKTYPSQARRMHWEGKTRVEFIIDGQGKVTQARVTDPSGYPVLDQEALATVRKAAPYPAPGQAAGREGLKLEIAIVFELN